MDPVDLTLAALIALSTTFTNGLQALKANQPELAVVELTKVIDDKHEQNIWRLRARYYRAVANSALGKRHEACSDLTYIIDQGQDDVLVDHSACLYGKLFPGKGRRLPHPYETLKRLLKSSLPEDIAPYFASKRVRDKILAMKAKHVWGYLEQEFWLHRFQTKLAWAHRSNGHAYVGILDPENDPSFLEMVADLKTGNWRIVKWNCFVEEKMGIPLKIRRNAESMVRLSGHLASWYRQYDKLPPSIKWRHRPVPVDDGGFTDDDDDDDFGENFPGWDGEDSDLQKAPKGWVWSGANEALPIPYKYEHKLNDQIVACAPVSCDGYRTVIRGCSFRIEQVPEQEFVKYAIDRCWWVPGVMTTTSVKPELSVRVKDLIRKLTDPKPVARLGARSELRRIGYPAYPFLHEVRNHRDPEVRVAVKELLTPGR